MPDLFLRHHFAMVFITKHLSCRSVKTCLPQEGTDRGRDLFIREILSIEYNRIAFPDEHYPASIDIPSQVIAYSSFREFTGLMVAA